MSKYEFDLVQQALDGNNYAYEMLLTSIVRDLQEVHGDNKSFVRLDVELVPGDGPAKTIVGELVGFTNKKTGTKKKYIIIYPDNIKYLLNKKSKKFANASPVEQQQMIFAEVFATFAHEFGHFIDITNPNRGALGAQISHIGEEIYDKLTTEKYLSNPTEVSSYEIEKPTRSAITQWLQQNNSRD